jgi:hypothetical protein
VDQQQNDESSPKVTTTAPKKMEPNTLATILFNLVRP